MMKKACSIAALCFAALLVFAACDNGSTSDPYKLFNEQMTQLSSGTPNNDDGALTDAEIDSVNFAALIAVGGYRGWTPDGFAGGSLTMIWTGKDGTTSITAALKTMLGSGNFSTFTDPGFPAGSTLEAVNYGADSRCLVMYAPVNISIEGMIIPPGTVMVDFGER